MNQIKEITNSSEDKIYRVADKIGMSRSYLYELAKGDELPRNVLLETLDRIAKELGYVVKVEFVEE